MSIELLVRERAAAAPVLILEDDFIRSGEMLAEVESLGLEGRILPSGSVPARTDPQDRYSLVVLTVRTLQPDDLWAAAAIRTRCPRLPLLLLTEEDQAGFAPWPNCRVIPKKDVPDHLREQVGEIAGIGRMSWRVRRSR